jgi:hypothetical protein
LKQAEARWPAVLDGLNADDDPHIRTLLLELRGFDTSSPREALDAIEAVCIESKRESETLTRWDLLERAQLLLRSARQ